MALSSLPFLLWDKGEGVRARHSKQGKCQGSIMIGGQGVLIGVDKRGDRGRGKQWDGCLCVLCVVWYVFCMKNKKGT